MRRPPRVNRWIGNRVAGEGVDDQNVEGSRRPAFQQQSAVAEFHLRRGGAVAQEGELLTGELLIVRVNFEEGIAITGAAVGGDRARAEADQADAQRAWATAAVRRAIPTPSRGP